MPINSGNNQGNVPTKSAMPGGSAIYRLSGVIGTIAALMLLLLIPSLRYEPMLSRLYAGTEPTLSTGWGMFWLFAAALAVIAALIATKKRDNYRGELLNLYMGATFVAGFAFILLVVAQACILVTGLLTGAGLVYLGFDWPLLTVFAFLGLCGALLCSTALPPKTTLLTMGIISGLGGCSSIAAGAYTTPYGALGCAMLFIGCACGIAFWAMYGKLLPADSNALSDTYLPAIFTKLNSAALWLRSFPLEFIPDSANVGASGGNRPYNYRRLITVLACGALCFILAVIGAFIPALGAASGLTPVAVLILRIVLPLLGLFMLLRAEANDKLARRIALILFAAEFVVIYPCVLSPVYAPFCSPASPVGLICSMFMCICAYLLLADEFSGRNYAPSTAPLWKLLADDLQAALHIGANQK